MFSLRTLLVAAALAAPALAYTPSGEYYGRRSILGQEVDITVNIQDSTTFNFQVKGSVNGKCEGEKFHYDGKTKLSVPDADKKSDCIYKLLSKYHLSLGALTYDPKTDSANLLVKAGFLVRVNFELKKRKTQEMSMLAVSKQPSGDYHGHKNILGQVVDLSVNIKDGNLLDFRLKGSVSGNCKDEKFTYDGKSAITVPSASNKGDCINKLLKTYHLKLGSITYDPKHDSAVLVVKAGFVKVKFALKKSANMLAVAAPHTLSGMYYGRKRILGLVYEVDINVHGNTFDFALRDSLHGHCNDEEYHYDGKTTVDIPTAQTPGDCINDLLATYRLNLGAMTYDPTTDTGNLVIQAGWVTVNFPMAKQTAPSLNNLKPLLRGAGELTAE